MRILSCFFRVEAKKIIKFSLSSSFWAQKNIHINLFILYMRALGGDEKSESRKKQHEVVVEEFSSNDVVLVR